VVRQDQIMQHSAFPHEYAKHYLSRVVSGESQPFPAKSDGWPSRRARLVHDADVEAAEKKQKFHSSYAEIPSWRVLYL